MTAKSTQQSSLMRFISGKENSSPSSSDDDTCLSVARSLSLVDGMDDEVHVPGKTGPSPSKRPRTSPHTASTWQGFCKKGTRFKAVLDDAFVRVVSSTSTSDSEGSHCGSTSVNRSGGTDNDSSRAQSAPPSASARLAQEKTAECILLKQELELVQSERTQLQALNKELREASKHQAARLQKMTSALQLASDNAARARADADMAEATAATLATQMQALQEVVEETKRASQILLNEQEEITRKAQSIEQKYIQAQAELARANTQRQQLKQENQELLQSTRRLEDRIKELQSTLDHQRAETKQWKRSFSETQAVENAQQQRMHRLEQELQESQTLLVDATSTAAETEATATDLKNSLEKLEQANQRLHIQLEEQQRKSRKEQHDHQQALEEVQLEAQNLKVQASSHQEQIQQLNTEKKAQEKRVTQLQLKASNLERRLQESTNLVAAATPTDAGPEFSIPTLGKENSIPTCKCSICFKDAVGIMKKCQCGRKDCNARAHATCINKIKAGPSVSHPGTPAPRLPIVLCGGVLKLRAPATAATAATAITPNQKSNS